MSVAAQTLSPPSRTLMFLEGRAISELGAFLGALPLLSLAPRGDGHARPQRDRFEAPASARQEHQLPVRGVRIADDHVVHSFDASGNAPTR